MGHLTRVALFADSVPALPQANLGDVRRPAGPRAARHPRRAAQGRAHYAEDGDDGAFPPLAADAHEIVPRWQLPRDGRGLPEGVQAPHEEDAATAAEGARHGR